ncbi:LacI family transcriptional regulator [bacterium]|nr:MAG: LacI family transcriptional regulator [bacterium]
MAVTLRDIAKSLNLSHATVSFVLNERRDVAIPDTTRQRVFARAQEMGYRPNRAARALVMGRTQMIALASPGVHRQPYGELFERFVAAARASGYETLLMNLGSPIDWAVDAVLQIDAPRDLSRAEGLPTMRLDLTGMDPDADVRFDAVDAARTATEHLLSRGSKRVAILASHQALNAPNGAAVGYTEVIEGAGKSPIRLVAADDTPLAFVEAMEQSLRVVEAPDGIVAVGTSAAIGAIRALANVGLSVPKDCRLVAVDGDGALGCLVPSVSAVEAPLAELAIDAAETLFLTLRPNPAGMIGPRVRTGTLVVRESSQ